MTFSVDACRKVLSKLVIKNELPFRFVETEGFIEFLQVIQPKWLKIPSRITVARDILSHYESEKKMLKSMLKGQRFCLTTDTWTSVQNLNYMCLTGHFIDADWKLQKKILSFLSQR